MNDIEFKSLIETVNILLEERDRRYSERLLAGEQALQQALQDSVRKHEQFDVRLVEMEITIRSLQDERYGIGILLKYFLTILGLIIAASSVIIHFWRK